MTKVALGVVGSLAAVAAGSPLVSGWIPGLASPADTAKTMTLWLTFAFSAIHLTYSLVMWRLLYPAYDINGRWKYRNEYDVPVEDGQTPAMASNAGWVEIRQSLEGISYKGSRTHRNDVSSASDVDFKALAFDVAEDGCGVMLYEVRRKATVRSMEELRIHTEQAGLAPTVIRGQFRALQPATYSGTVVYKYEGPCTLLDRIVETLRSRGGKTRT